MNEIPSRYNPKETEDKWYRFWEENNLFAAKPNPSKRPFCIVIPPPNVTGILHMGHALNNTIQDILIRYHRMKSEESLWMPGTDHAGIATQNVVEKAIAKEGLKRQDLGREKFLERVWQWKEQYGSTIIRQLKKLGASCDWPRTRFTMDEEYSKAVIEVFVRLYEKGLIYQGNYIINWCPRCQTALSDEEAPHRELQGNLYYLRYPFKVVKGQSPTEKENISTGTIPYKEMGTFPYLVVATTRPETMLGDTAVAVNPKDKRYKKLIGKTLILPLVNREIKIIADGMVDMKFGTGAVKVTPAHDPGDYILGKKHELEFVNVMHPDGRMNENAGNYNGMDRFQAREFILEALKEKGLLEKVEPHTFSAGHCYRCHTIIEPYLSKQWFVKMKPLAKPAIEVVKKGKIKFYPPRWTKVYLNWMENIQDWCISRQIWWGHRLPVYYCKNCQESGVRSQESGDLRPATCDLQPATDSGIIVSKTRPDKCPKCGSSDIYQDNDVLDTWFSSWLWPFATFYWSMKGLSPKGTVPEEDLNYFYPTSVLVTAPEIIFFWVARMIMAGLEFMKDIPFKDVYIHGTVRDIEGRKMSKSLGNIIDPLEIIDRVGADALRFSLISVTAQGQDVFLSEEKFQMGRNFANKIWNASRFILMNLDVKGHVKGQSLSLDCARDSLRSSGTVPCKELSPDNLINRWILSRFYSVLKELNKDLDNYRFNEAANLLYGFFWHEFCDWYLELAKPILVNSSRSGLNPTYRRKPVEAEYRNTQIVMYEVLEKFLRALHPFMPFITEEIWQRLNEATRSPGQQATSIMAQPWPHIQEQMIDKKIEKQTQSLFELITQIRNLRSYLELKPEQKVKVSVYPHAKIKKQFIQENGDLIINLAKLEKLDILSSQKRPRATISAIVEDIDIYLHFTGLLDIAKEQEKINEKMKNLELIVKSKEAHFKDPEFASKAPPEVVQKEKQDIDRLNSELKRLEKMLHELQ
jgi:valyl-tRNA synthetase